MSNKNNKKAWFRQRTFLITSLIVIVLWLGLGVIAFFLDDEWEDRGTFGDMFGSINALFSGLAFAGVLTTLILQRQDLEIQREVQVTQLRDLKQQAEATKKSAEQLERQHEILNFQIIQQTVLNLIESKRKFVQNFKKFEFDTSKGEFITKYTGEDALVKQFADGKFDHPDINQFLNIFFYTLKFIHESTISTEQKKVLADMLNLETSSYEMTVIYMAPFEEREFYADLLSTYGFDQKYDFILEYAKNHPFEVKTYKE